MLSDCGLIRWLDKVYWLDRFLDRLNGQIGWMDWLDGLVGEIGWRDWLER